MQPAAASPNRHVFVCCNRRDESSPLGTGCDDRGEALYAVLKDEVARRGQVASTWVTRTHCLGICPKRGATVAICAAGAERVLTEALPSDAGKILDLADDEPLSQLEAQQRQKVLDLARRLKPGLTEEDVLNPHDFAELADADWQYQDGILAGIRAAASAVRARPIR